jgi:2-amino-4-hydroxy-6-hydroxymethyldihydropteridine diphosphokinase
VTDAYIALGSNLGDRLANLGAALRELAAEPGVSLRWVSHAYESEPWGVTDQRAFANAVTALAFEGEANVLLEVCKDIERRLGRTPGERFGPRVIDLDILLFGDEEWRSDELTVPHPRMLERDFVVTPLLEVAPEAALPDGSRVTRDGARSGRVTGVLGPVPGFEAVTPGERPPRPAAGIPGTPAAGGDDDAFVVLPEVPPSPAEAAEEWVAVGPVRYELSTPNSSADFSLLLYEQALREAGVPSEFYPHRPGEGASFLYGLPREVRLMVPRSREREALEIVRQMRSGGGPGDVS